LRRTDVKGHKGLFQKTAGSRARTADPLTIDPTVAPSGYGPADLASAYKLPTGNGAGQTVAIVDAYNDPAAAADLAVYRAQYGLPACTVANGCFQQVNQNGQTSPLPANDGGWAEEESLDVDMVSAICPNCHIMLLEANTTNTTDLFAAEDRAVALGAKFISNSFGAPEYPQQNADDFFHFNHPGVVITAATGDSGTGALYPAVSPGVTAVGGTSLHTASNTRGWTETAWSLAGSGCSSNEYKANWQNVTTGCATRADADVSAVADPATGVAVYNTYSDFGWDVYGGTSVATPIIASVYALAGTPGASDYPAAYPYAHPGDLFDVTSGSNGACGAPLCTAGPGWDGPTGLGTPDGTAAFTTSGGTPPPPPRLCGGFSVRPTQTYPPGWSFSNCKGLLAMQTDGNFVLYNQHGVPIWATNTAGHPGAEAVWQNDGNLVVYTASGQPIWASNTAGRAPNGYFNLQDDGNLVIYNAAGQPVYASNTVHI
jgi:hypothetical protein